MQVVTNENVVDLIQGKTIPEFKAPDPKPTETPVEVKTDAPAKVENKPETPRGEDGKFQKVEADKTGDKPVDEKKVDADDDVVLTRKIEKLINKKHRAMKEAEEFGASEARRAIEAERRAADLQRQIEDLKGTKSEAQAGDEPKPEDFKTVGEYTRALVKYEAKQAGEKGQQNAIQSQQQAEANKLISEFVDRQEAFKKATPDYEDVLAEADFEIPNLAQQYLIESDAGPQLAYHLAKNPDVAASLRKLSPRKLLAQLGKLEMKLEPTETAKATVTSNGVSKAPAPIQPLEAKTTPVTKDPKDMSFAELRAFRDAERRAKR